MGSPQRIRLREFLAENQSLMTAYLLRDDLKRLWTYTRGGWARRAWEDWLERTMESGIPALKTFTRNLAKRIDGVLAQCRWSLSTSVLEGMNNKIKAIKHTAMATPMTLTSSSTSALPFPESHDEPYY